MFLLSFIPDVTFYTVTQQVIQLFIAESAISAGAGNNFGMSINVLVNELALSIPRISNYSIINLPSIFMVVPDSLLEQAMYTNIGPVPVESRLIAYIEEESQSEIIVTKEQINEIVPIIFSPVNLNLVPKVLPKID